MSKKLVAQVVMKHVLMAVVAMVAVAMVATAVKTEEEVGAEKLVTDTQAMAEHTRTVTMEISEDAQASLLNVDDDIAVNSTDGYEAELTLHLDKAELNIRRCKKKFWQENVERCLPAEPIEKKSAFPGIKSIPATLTWTDEEGVAQEKKIAIVAGQHFLNDKTSMFYAESVENIKQAKAKILKAGGKFFDKLIDGAEIYAIRDGHHRIIWAAFHGQKTNVKVVDKQRLGSADSMDTLVYEP